MRGEVWGCKKVLGEVGVSVLGCGGRRGMMRGVGKCWEKCR